MDDSQSSQGNISPMPPHPPVQKGECDTPCWTAAPLMHLAAGCGRWGISLLLPMLPFFWEWELLRRTEWQGQTGGKYGHRVRMQPCPLTLLKLTMSTTAIEISPGSQTKIRKDAERGWEYVLNGSFPKQCPQYYRNHFYCHSFMSYLAEG